MRMLFSAKVKVNAVGKGKGSGSGKGMAYGESSLKRPSGVYNSKPSEGEEPSFASGKHASAEKKPCSSTGLPEMNAVETLMLCSHIERQKGKGKGKASSAGK
jgi:hypothetical protein